MQLTAQFDGDEIARLTQIAEQRLAADMQPTLNVVGVQLLSWAKLDYDTKGRGGTGSDGIKWKALAASTLKAKDGKKTAKKQKNRATTKSGKARPTGSRHQIGVESGLQRSSATPGFKAAGGGNVLQVTASSVTVGFGRSYSKYFDAERKLLPDVLPERWERDLNAIIERRAEKIIREVFGSQR